MSLSERMKVYERAQSTSAMRKTPLIIRVDGKAFHTLTKNLCSPSEPFDSRFISAMNRACVSVAEQMQGFKLAYVQSDEATFCLTDYDNVESQPWLGYRVQKLVSISAALMSVAFNKYFNPCARTAGLAVFDSRAFSVPRDEVINLFLWRALDWKRNSLNMYCSSFFSHKELQGKTHTQRHEMLYTLGKNWAADLSSTEKNRTYIYKTSLGLQATCEVLPTYKSLDSAFGSLF